MSGTGMESSARNICAAFRASARFSSCENPSILPIHCTSAPALNTVPDPRMTTARMEPSAGTLAANAVSCSIMSSLKALRTSGRLSVTVVTVPRFTRTALIDYILKMPNFASGIGAL